MPTSLSPEAQAVLAMAATRPIDWPAYPGLSDRAAWLAYAEACDTNMRAMVDTIPQDEAVTTSTVPLGHSNCFLASAGTDDADRVVLDIHGGALIGGGGVLCERMAGRLAASLQATVYAPDYRMPPLHPFPTPLDDCMEAYRYVLAFHSPDQVIVHGSSAGGNLAAAMMLRSVQESLPLPAAIILETPELDLTESGDTFETNMYIDTVLGRGLGPVNALYAAGHDPADPLLSPLFGDFARGFPPTLLTAGTRDLFLSNAVRMLHRLREASVPVELLVYEAMPHGGFFGTPEDRAVEKDLKLFADATWSRTSGKS
ncbi:alpha/beta hydrolase [Tsuneonella sp. HG222]